MYNPRLDAFVHRLIRIQAHPRRCFHLHELLRMTTLNDSGSSFLSAIVILVGVGLYLTMETMANDWRFIQGVAFLSCAFLLGSIFIWRQWLFVEVIQHGVITRAIVQDVQCVAPHSRRYGKRLRYGMATGQWHISTDRGQYQAHFTIYQPWNQRLYKGAEVQVLVHPWRWITPYPLKLVD